MNIQHAAQCIFCLSMTDIVLKLSNEVQRHFIHIFYTILYILLGQKQYILSDKFFGQRCILSGQPERNTNQVLCYRHNNCFCKVLLVPTNLFFWNGWLKYNINNSLWIIFPIWMIFRRTSPIKHNVDSCVRHKVEQFWQGRDPLLFILSF